MKKNIVLILTIFVSTIFIAGCTKTKPVVPTIISFSPSTDTAGSKIIITGTYLQDATWIEFGKVGCPQWVIYSDSLLIATVPDGATSGVITVGNTSSSTASEGIFTFIP